MQLPASARALYGNITPHTLLLFVVEEPGALGTEAMQFPKNFKRKLRDSTVFVDSADLNWSNRGHYFFQSFSLANIKGLGHFVNRAAGILHS